MVIVEKASLEVRNANLIKLWEFHQATLDELGVSTQFVPKMAYPFENRLHIQFFPSEVNKKCDFYMELCDCNNLPQQMEEDGIIINPNRELYKWIFNPNYQKKQKISQKGTPLYMIPVTDLVLINKSQPSKPEIKKSVHVQKELFTSDSEYIVLSQATISDIFLELAKRFKGK